ncbi:MAG: hypothetical protein KA175_02105 [Flavobacteriales bacterium]|nr:hypothetical protein [Flavobacteriales bacterium]MBP6696382.1 hypothetical protein [Flavobacteriales bacterium]
MKERLFIHDQKVVEASLKNLQTVATTGYKSTEFIDPTTRLRWEKYPIGYNDDGDDEFGLRRLPYPTTEDLIHIAVTSDVVDEIEGAAMLLKDQEWNHLIEFREALLNAIELHWKRIESERFSIIEGCTELTSKGNRREIVGKSDAEIIADADYFRHLGQIATELVSRLSANKE